MDINQFTFSNGITMSVFAMLVVFIILILIQLILMLFRFLPKDHTDIMIPEEMSKPMKMGGDDEDELVAMLMASVLAKDEFKGNVRIKSVKRIG